jgi:hypothetical protein
MVDPASGTLSAHPADWGLVTPARSFWLGLVAIWLALGLAACAGGTDDAANVRANEARLRAHGYTNDGPATWWWEYDTVKAELGTASDTEVCGSGSGPKEPDNRCGPATGGSASNTIPLNVIITGLAPDTTYHFRACGQDTNDPSPTCANVRNFRTSKGDSAASVNSGVLTFTAAAGTRNHVLVSSFTDTDGVDKYKIEDPVDHSEFASFDGSSIVPGAGCASFSGRPFDDAVKCPVAGITRLALMLGDLDDNANVLNSITIPSTLNGGAGADQLSGSDGANDVVISGPDGFFAAGGPANTQSGGGGGDDTIEAQNGVRDIVYCGEGNDVANVDAVDDSLEGLFGATDYETCEEVNEIP